MGGSTSGIAIRISMPSARRLRADASQAPSGSAISISKAVDTSASLSVSASDIHSSSGSAQGGVSITPGPAAR